MHTTESTTAPDLFWINAPFAVIAAQECRECKVSLVAVVAKGFLLDKKAKLLFSSLFMIQYKEILLDYYYCYFKWPRTEIHMLLFTMFLSKGKTCLGRGEGLR